jgi:allantoinase
VEPGHLLHRHKLSPYVGSVLPGIVRETWLRGRKVFGDGEIQGGPSGSLLLRGRSS